MISTLVLIVTLLLFLLISVIILRAVITRQQFIGRPPLPLFYFILAKVMVAVNLTFLFLKGLRIDVFRYFQPPGYIEIFALVLLIAGTCLIFLSTFKLNKDLIFGLPSTEDHRLQTRGIYALSRHPFYLGFIFILFSSCLFNPHYLNIAAFIIAWIAHHFIMNKEEQFLTDHYGDEYRQYAKSVKRYIII